MRSVPTLFERAVHEFDRRVSAIDDDQWDSTTPCPDWSVRDLVNHVVNEDLWIVPLLDGKTIEEVGDAFDGDLLGDAPKTAWARAARGALQAVQRDGAMEITAHLSFGDVPGREYVTQVLTDHVIHAWDLSRGIGADDELDTELVAFVSDFLEPQIEMWRQGGAFGPAVQVSQGADPQTKLLAMTGRDRAK